jgi:hypothetical protein
LKLRENSESGAQGRGIRSAGNPLEIKVLQTVRHLLCAKYFGGYHALVSMGRLVFRTHELPDSAYERRRLDLKIARALTTRRL